MKRLQVCDGLLVSLGENHLGLRKANCARVPYLNAAVLTGGEYLLARLVIAAGRGAGLQSSAISAFVDRIMRQVLSQTMQLRFDIPLTY